MKSAKLYRQAEAKGISMIGNSWSVSSSATNLISTNKSSGSTNQNIAMKQKRRSPLKYAPRPGRKRTRNPAINPGRERCSDERNLRILKAKNTTFLLQVTYLHPRRYNGKKEIIDNSNDDDVICIFGVSEAWRLVHVVISRAAFFGRHFDDGE